MEPRPFLSGLRRRLRTVLVVEGLSRIAILAVVLFAATALLDWLEPLPAALRVLVLLGFAIGTGLIAWHRLIRPLGCDMGDDALARLSERHLPLEGRLFTALDGIELTEGDQNHLRSTLDADARRALVHGDGAARRGVAAGLLVIAFTAVAVSSGSQFSIAWKRVLLPLGATTWPKTAALDGRIERPVVAADEPMVIAFERTRGRAAQVRIDWQDQDGRADGRVPSTIEGPWREAISLPAGDYSFSLSTKDAHPVPLTGKVVPRPGIRPLSVTLTPPAYTGREAQELSALAIESALPGSTVRFGIALESGPDRDGDAVTVHLGEASLAVERDGDRIDGEFTIASATELIVHVEDHYETVDGQVVIAARPQPSFTIGVGEDRRPVVRLGGPRRNEAVTPKALIDLEVAASDDIALASLSIEQAVHRQDEESGERKAGPSEVLHAFDQVAGRIETVRRRSVTVGDHATTGELLELVATASDANDVSGPGVGRSESLLLKVVTEEELRQELDRALADVRDRLAQSREELVQGLAKPESLVEASRGSKAVARRAADVLASVTRRWRQNQLDPERQGGLDQADDLVGDQALPELEAAAAGGEAGTEAARRADQALGEAERLVASMLSSDDLVRELRTMVTRQQALADESRSFVLESMTGQGGEAAEAQQQNLVQRQEELAAALKEWERKVLGTRSEQQQGARDMVREEQPADRLDQAAGALGEEGGGQRAVDQQQAALEAMESLLRELRGGNEVARLGQLLGELADRQERLESRLADGEDPASLADEQEALAEETRRAQERVESEADSEEANEALSAAKASQEQAQQSMESGKGNQAQRQAGAAASQLRQAQRALQQQQQQGDEQDEQQEQPEQPDIMALLRRLEEQQVKIVTDATNAHVRFQEAHLAAGGRGIYRKLPFDGLRWVGPIADAEADVLLLLEEQGIKELEQQPIARRALGRVHSAIERAQSHFEQPAMGERGVRLAQIALYEIKRLLEIAENLPSPQQEENQGQGQQPGQGGRQAPFPPRAELALLRALQEELAWAVKSGLPGAHGAGQVELRDLVRFLLDNSRPGTRPYLLLERTERAMASAAQLLEEADRGSIVRNEQDLAVAALTRLLEEAQAGGGGESGNQQQSQQQQNQGEGQSNKSQADGQGSQGGQGAQAGGSGGEGEAGAGADLSVQGAGSQESGILRLPPEAREALQEALREQLPPEARALFLRYVEILEEEEE